MGNPFQIMQAYNQFMQNPIAMLSRRYNIPQGLHAPQDIVQHLLNSGQITQEQLNGAMNMRNDPSIRGLFR